MSSDTWSLMIIETTTTFYLVASMDTMDGEQDTLSSYVKKRELSSWYPDAQLSTPLSLLEVETIALESMCRSHCDWRPAALQITYLPNTPTFESIEYYVDISSERN